MVSVGALLIKNQLTLLVIKHMEKLIQQEMMSNLELKLAMFVHMDVPHAQITKLNAFGLVIKPYQLVMIQNRQVKTIITTQLTSSATNR
jgi:hypothetical protein